MYGTRRSWHMARHIEVDVLANLRKHGLLDAGELSAQLFDGVAQVENQLASLLRGDRAWLVLLLLSAFA